LTKVIVLAATALTFRSVESLIIAFTLHQFVSLLFLFWYLHGKFPRFWTHFDWAFFKEQLAYALPYGALGLLWVVQRDLDNYFVSAMLGPRDYAIYAVGWLDVPLISLLLESAGPVMIVRVSKLQQENRKSDIRSVTAAATSHMAAIQYPLFMLLLVAGHDLIILLYTRAYERSADIFLISILLLPMDVLLFDPIARAYKNLRNFALGLRIAVFITLLCVLFPVVRHFGMIGAAITAVSIQIIERAIIGWRVAREVDASAKDLALYRDYFKVCGVTVAAGVVAYLVRNLISPRLLIPRILAVGVCGAAVYLAGVFVFRLPGREQLSKERLLFLLRSTRARLSGTTA
jgi:O-antigen/teichoic acid export membrane protein